MKYEAEVNSDGTEFWRVKGKYHREGDKPAAVYADGSQEWFKKGIEMTEQQCYASPTSKVSYCV